VARGRASRPREERAPASKLLGEVAGRTSAAGNKGPGRAPSGEQGEAAAELGLQDAMGGKRAGANQEEDRTGTRAGPGGNAEKHQGEEGDGCAARGWAPWASAGEKHLLPPASTGRKAGSAARGRRSAQAAHANGR
jgi:hypothetical protein